MSGDARSFPMGIDCRAMPHGRGHDNHALACVGRSHNRKHWRSAWRDGPGGRNRFATARRRTTIGTTTSIRMPSARIGAAPDPASMDGPSRLVKGHCAPPIAIPVVAEPTSATRASSAFAVAPHAAVGMSPAGCGMRRQNQRATAASTIAARAGCRPMTMTDGYFSTAMARACHLSTARSTVRRTLASMMSRLLVGGQPLMRPVPPAYASCADRRKPTRPSSASPNTPASRKHMPPAQNTGSMPTAPTVSDGSRMAFQLSSSSVMTRPRTRPAITFRTVAPRVTVRGAGRAERVESAADRRA
jgi:hypothetical protein